jgi:hypothetical protein
VPLETKVAQLKKQLDEGIGWVNSRSLFAHCLKLFSTKRWQFALSGT